MYLHGKCFGAGKRAIEQGIEQGKELGIAMGEASGEARLARLIKVLIDENKYEEINRATVSEKDRKELYRQYGIVDE